MTPAFSALTELTMLPSVPSPASMSTGALPSSLSSRTEVPPVVRTSVVLAVFVKLIEKAEAVCSTVKDRVPGTALAAAVPVTCVELLVVVVGAHEDEVARACALVVRAANFALIDCRLLTVPCSVESLDLSSVWGAASTCISWLMMVAVSSPLTSPLTLAFAIALSSSSALSGPATASPWRARP